MSDNETELKENSIVASLPHNTIQIIYKTKERSLAHQCETVPNETTMRLLSIFTLFCVLAAGYTQSHDLVLGQATYGDVIIYKVNESKYGFPFFVRTSILEYPEPGQTNFAYIKAIFIKDNDKDGTGGWPTVSAGGIGQRFVKIKLKSQRGYGLNFTVTIYGRY